MLAVKHLDPIMGIDVHIVQPPGPVPPAVADAVASAVRAALQEMRRGAPSAG